MNLSPEQSKRAIEHELTSWVRRVIAALMLVIASQSFASHPSSITLPNGLRVVMFPDEIAPDEHSTNLTHDNPLQIWLQLNAGSISERDNERGSAMALKRALMFGTRSMSEQEIRELFIRSGADSSIGHGAFTHFDQTTFMLSAQDEQTLDGVLSFYADILSDTIEIDQQSLDRAVGGLLGVLEQYPSNAMRRWMPEILAGAPVGDRMPLAQAEELERLTTDRVNAFAQRNYAAPNATLIIVGAFDTDQLLDRVHNELGAIDPRIDAPEAPRASGSLANGRVSVVASDLDRSDVALVWFEHNRFEHADTESTTRRLVLEKVAAELVRHRINTQVFRTIEGVVETDGSIVNLYGSVRAAQVVAAIDSEDPDAWSAALDALTGEINRLTSDPISEAEFTRARRASLLQWKSDQDDWSGMSSRERARACNWIINAGLFFDPAHWADDASRVLATITNDEIHATIKRVFEPTASNVIVLSDHDPLPKREAVHEHFDSNRDLRLPKLAADWITHGAPPILASIPIGGEIREISQHPESAVWTARLRNGVVVRQRTMSDNSSTSELRVALQRSIEDRTLEDAAIAGWRSPSTTKLSADEIRAILNEHGITLDVRTESESVQLILRAPDGAIKHAIELAYVLLSDAEIDEHAYERWRRSAEDKSGSTERLLETAFDAFIRSDHRALPRCSPASSITLQDASRALHEFARSAPIEIAIAAPDDAEETLEYAETLFGALSAREQPNQRRYEIETSGAMEPECLLTVRSDDLSRTGAVVGFTACDVSDLESLRALILSSLILNARLTDLAQAGQLPSSANIRVTFDDRAPGRAILLAEAPGSDTRAMGDTIENLLADFAQSPPSQEEMDTQTAFVGRALESQIHSTHFWGERLATLSARGYTPDDVWRIRDDYLGMSAQTLHERFAACYARGRHIRVEVRAD
jgi:zinc protease